jgi:hypothetical protein
MEKKERGERKEEEKGGGEVKGNDMWRLIHMWGRKI